MTFLKHYVLHLNPEPWAVGSVTHAGKGARIGPNPNLVAFQNAVRESLEGAEMLPETQYKLTFYFWRQQARYLDMSDHIRQRNQADATNLQKGLEDALQGTLFKNDRDVRDIRSIIVDQGPGVNPGIIIKAESAGDYIKDVLALPSEILEHLIQEDEKALANTKWQDSDELF